MFRNKSVRNKKNIMCKKCDFCDVTCVPVNNVFPPDVREPLLEYNTTQQSPPGIACPGLQAHVNGVPTQVLLDTGSVVSGISERFLRVNKKYFRNSNK